MSSSSSEGKASSCEGNTNTLLSEDYAEIVDDDADYSTPAGKLLPSLLIYKADDNYLL